MLFYIQRSDDDITHHGIKGQKWGVRRFQNKDGTRTAAGMERLRNGDGSSSKGISPEMRKASGADFDGYVAKGKATLSDKGSRPFELSMWDHYLNDVYLKSWTSTIDEDAYVNPNKWTDKQKEVYNEHRDIERVSAKKVTSEKDLKRKDPPDTAIEALSNTETKIGKGHQLNCMYCAAAFELRRRGYDVHANSRFKPGNDTEMKEWYKNPEQKAYKPASKAFDEILKQPDGARGTIGGCGPWGGHEISYEVKNKKVSLYDAQTKMYWNQYKFEENYGFAVVTRLDNAEINWKAIGEVISDDSVVKRGN